MAKNRNVPNVVVVLITCPTKASARRLAEELVKRRAAACVNIVPSIDSVFRWQGRLERSREVLLVVKTTAAHFESLRRAVVRLHPYDVPEVIALPLVAGHRPYLQWVERALAAS